MLVELAQFAIARTQMHSAPQMHLQLQSMHVVRLITSQAFAQVQV